ncbi:hypothetical protein [Aquipseudomonas campi]
MLKVLTGTLALLPMLALGADAYTDAEASAKAKLLIKDAQELRKEVSTQCAAGDAAQLNVAATKAQVALTEWPNDNLKYRALFPYDACRQLMSNIESYARTCALGAYKGEAQRYEQQRWSEDLAECSSAIQNPDLSLKDLD